LATAPWTAGVAHPWIVPWWQDAVKQEVFAIPPVRASPWHGLHSLAAEPTKPGWVERKFAGWLPC